MHTWRCLVLLTPLLACGQAGFDGVVVDAAGRGIDQAVVIASGVGLERSAITDRDGKFHLKTAGAFVSVRRIGFAPRVVRVAELPATHRIQLIVATDAMLDLPRCKALPGVGKGWIGGGLRLKPSSSSRGPERDGPDGPGAVSQWFVKVGKSTLRIVDGDLAHAGLPFEEVLRSSMKFETRGWTYHGMVGLDLKGESVDGRRWRWFGTADGASLEYAGASREDAESLDRMFGFACYEATQLERR